MPPPPRGLYDGFLFHNEQCHSSKAADKQQHKQHHVIVTGFGDVGTHAAVADIAIAILVLVHVRLHGVIDDHAAVFILADLPVVVVILQPIVALVVTQRITVGEGIIALLAALAGVVVSSRVGAVSTRCLVGFGEIGRSHV